MPELANTSEPEQRACRNPSEYLNDDIGREIFVIVRISISILLLAVGFAPLSYIWLRASVGRSLGSLLESRAQALLWLAKL